MGNWLSLLLATGEEQTASEGIDRSRETLNKPHVASASTIVSPSNWENDATTYWSWFPCAGGENGERSSAQRDSDAVSGEDKPVGLQQDLTDQRHDAFWQLVSKLLAMNDVFVMINELLDHLFTVVGASQGAVFLVDANASVISKISRSEAIVLENSTQRGFMGLVLRTKAPSCAVNFADDRHFDKDIDLNQQFAFQKLICVPLVDKNNVYAVIQATTSQLTRREVDELDVKLLTWLGPILSSSMRKCIEFHDVLLSERTQKALLHIISSSDTEATVLSLVDDVIAGACHISKAERVTLFMVNWENDDCWALSSSCHEENLRVPLTRSLLGLAVTTRTIVNITNASRDERFKEELDRRNGIQIRCALYVPVGVQTTKSRNSRPLAVLEILNKEKEEAFTLDDECAFEAFACEVAVILRRRSNEIEYIKLLTDTRAERVLAQRAKSQANLLEAYTSYTSAMSSQMKKTSNRLYHFLSRKHLRECAEGDQREEQDMSTLTLREVQEGSEAITLEPTGSFVARETKCPSDSSGLSVSSTGSSHLTVTYRFRNGSEDHATNLFSWSFNVFEFQTEELMEFISIMFYQLNVDEILQIDTRTIANFIAATKEKYHPNPFHNFFHAFSVCHATFLIMTLTQDASDMMNPLEVAGALIAALCHDVDHPGHTNSFEIATRSQLALLYSDESVLERHHAYTTFRILSRGKNTNLLRNLDVQDYRHIRKVIVNAILGTDMAFHFKIIDALEKIVYPSTIHHHVDPNVISGVMKRDSKNGIETLCASGNFQEHKDQNASKILNVVREAVLFSSSSCVANAGGGVAVATGLPSVDYTNEINGSRSTPAINAVKGRGGFQQHNGSERSPRRSADDRRGANSISFGGSEEERLFLTRIVVHAADLSGQVMPKPIALKWSNMVSKEFANQALLEQAEGLSVSYQHLDDPLEMVEGQHFFSQKIVAPLWHAMYGLFPELRICVQNLSENIIHYEQEIKRLNELKHTESAADAAQLAPTRAPSEPSDSVMEEDEGRAVPGVVKNRPAKFNSFRKTNQSRETDTEEHSDETPNGSINGNLLSALERHANAVSPRGTVRKSSCSSCGSLMASDLDDLNSIESRPLFEDDEENDDDDKQQVTTIFKSSASATNS